MTSLNTTPLRVAVLGCGRMGLATSPLVRRSLPSCWLPLSHAEAVISHPGLELVGLCDPFSVPRQQAAALFPRLSIYSDPETLLKELRPDLVCIATRTPERPALIELCVQYGVRRLHLEKPLCRSHAELLRLTDLLTATGTHCTFGALRRYLAPFREAQNVLLAGGIGSLQQVQVNLGFGALCWTQIHAIDLIAAFLDLNTVTEVRALADPNSFNSNGYVLDGDPLMRFVHISTIDGPQGIVSAAGGCDLFLYGDTGIVSVNNDGENVVLRQSPVNGAPYWTEQKRISVPDVEHSGTAAALDRLVNADQKTAVGDTQAILKSQALLFACAQSILEGGNPIDSNNLNPGLTVTGRSGTLFA
jgi:scyllo-inositol 2-dehydrogenase (NAD+)